VEKAVDEEGSRGLVELVFDRNPSLRDLDDDIDVIWGRPPDRDLGKVHEADRR